jgi:hypothetical protein
MRFKLTRLATPLLCSLLLSGCGLFGSKKENDRIFQPQTDIGCLNGLGKKVGRYFKGTIEASEWEAIFNCVEDQVVFFRKFVRANAQGGYTQGDIASLMRNFLITEKPVSDEFVSTIFEIKASFFGGKPDTIAPRELDQFLNLIHVLKKESLIVLPYVQARVSDPTIQNLQAQADALAVFGQRVAGHLESRVGLHVVSKLNLIPFARELMRLLDLDPKLVNRYQDFIFSLKAIVAGGSIHAVEGFAWPIMLREGLSFSGLLLAYRDFPETSSRGPNIEGEFNLALAERATQYAEKILATHGGAIPVELLNPAIDSLPMGGLTIAKRQAIKASLPKVLKRTLHGREMGRLDIGSLKTMLDLFANGVKGQTLLEQIYSSIPASVSLEEFVSEATKNLERATDLNEQIRIQQLIDVAHEFVGLYPESSNVMYFSKEMRGMRTKNHMVRMHWYKLVGDYVLSTYAVEKNARLGTLNDLQSLTEDFIEVLTAWKLSHPLLTPREMAIKRFREANLFTPVSNGDQYMDVTETSYYFAYLFSAANLSSKTYKSLTKIWKVCPIVGPDEIGQPAMEARCFREHYFENFELFWAGFPDLVQSYRRMSPAKRLTLQKSMESAARRKGYNEDLIGLYDVNSFAALPHYLENVVERFDRNGDEILSKKEILTQAYPVFKQTLIDVSGRKQDWLLQAALTYAIKFKRLPQTKKEQIHFLSWAAWRPFWKVSADRGSLYEVLAILSNPKSIPKETARSLAQ